MRSQIALHRTKKRSSFLVVTGISLVITFGMVWFVWQFLEFGTDLTRVVSTDQSVNINIVIPSGANTTEVAKMLEDENVIVSDSAFVKYVRSEHLDEKILAGKYVLKPSKTIPEIVEALTGRSQTLTSITIPEGFSLRQIEDLLQKKGLIRGGEITTCSQKCSFPFPFLQPAPRQTLEGYLFPNTYVVDQESFQVEVFLNELLKEFNDQVQVLEGALQKSKRTLDQVVIMASMVEKEAITDEERPIVAGILWKRLDTGWYLGVDATTRYYKNDWKDAITASDLKNDNTYNTRINKGLPPTPICNPGIESIRAALIPESSPYWYYLHDKNRQIHYAKTQEEHDRNRVKYL